MRVAILTTDVREPAKDYSNPVPQIGVAPLALLEGFAGLSDVEVHVISCLQEPAAPCEKLAPNIWYHGLHVPKIGWMRTLYQGCIRAVRKKLKEIAPDIVHGQGTERECGISAAFSGFPNVVTVHGNMLSIAEYFHAKPFSYYWTSARLESWALRRTDGVFCNSDYTEKLVSPRARRIWRVPNALRSEFLNQPIHHPSSNVPVLVNVGSIISYKRQLEILFAAGNLWKKGFRFEMHFVGSGDSSSPYGTAFLQAVQSPEHAPFARLVGSLKSDQLIQMLDRASAMVHFPEEESFGLVVAEALARNLKLFVPRVGGIPDIATGVDGAEILGANDFAGLENAIARWLESGAPRPVNAAETIRRRYHPRVVAEQHLEIYRQVVGV
jgi:glycosyltransferase involved in cell wall biosynthesis